ncbi:hypothetical protein COO60DRAFT_1479797, partial [Scenedesmus sp. NREL 46B-D3]
MLCFHAWLHASVSAYVYIWLCRTAGSQEKYVVICWLCANARAGWQSLVPIRVGVWWFALLWQAHVLNALTAFRLVTVSHLLWVLFC